MINSQQKMLRLAAGLVALAIALGAFGAHALNGRLSAYSLAIYEKAAFYHMTQSLGLLIMTALSSNAAVINAVAVRAAKILMIGIFIFSGSLYALALTEERWLGAITPFGGAAMICAWGYFAIAGFCREARI